MICALTLLGFAGLQLNDPDPIRWVSFYILCALVPLFLVFNIYSSPLFLLAVAACLLCLAVAGPGAVEYYRHMDQELLMQSMNPDKPYIEEAREFLGALIALGLVIISGLMARNRYLKVYIRAFKGKKITVPD
ncbi:MAG: transmembrane 220 family protein [Pseudomonadota bacterium]